MYHRILIVFFPAVISLRSLAYFASENKMNKFFMGMALFWYANMFIAVIAC